MKVREMCCFVPKLRTDANHDVEGIDAWTQLLFFHSHQKLCDRRLQHLPVPVVLPLPPRKRPLHVQKLELLEDGVEHNHMPCVSGCKQLMNSKSTKTEFTHTNAQTHIHISRKLHLTPCSSIFWMNARLFSSESSEPKELSSAMNACVIMAGMVEPTLYPFFCISERIANAASVKVRLINISVKTSYLCDHSTSY